MDDTGSLVDLVVAGMMVAAVSLGLMVIAPRRWFRWTRWSAVALIVAAMLGAAGILSASATIYGDGSTH